MVLIFITKNIMKKKVIYLNAKTGKEVQYGEQISFKESGKFENGYSFSSEISLPVINATIPDLIEKGILIQKEVEIEEIQPNKINKVENNKDVDNIIDQICQTYKKQEQLLDLFTTQIEVLSTLIKQIR